jgi:hypothetical protein
VPLAATGADQVAAPSRALVVIVFSDGEGCAAAARDQEHAQGHFRNLLVLAAGLAVWFHKLRFVSGGEYTFLGAPIRLQNFLAKP